MLRARLLARPALNAVRVARLTTATSTTHPTQPQPASTPASEASATTQFDSATDIAPAALEHTPVVTADAISGAPQQLRHRVVRIYKPTANTMQSGGSRNTGWRIDWDTMLGGGRWENPLMGWASSADYMQGTRMTFSTKEDAMRFADKQGALVLVSFRNGFTDTCLNRVGLLCAGRGLDANSAKELRRELCLPSQPSAYRTNKVDSSLIYIDGCLQLSCSFVFARVLLGFVFPLL